MASKALSKAVQVGGIMNQGIGSSVDTSDPLTSRELRFAVTMNGGVSLAVYMGGAAHELNQLTVTEGPYRRLLDFVDHRPTPMVDVLTGTSAGGINAAALALAQANDNPTDLSVLKKLWIQHGQIGSLLRQPFQKGASSLMQGDDYFLPQIESAFQGLITDYARSKRPVDLTITTTLLNPVAEKSVDDLGTGIVQTQHAGLFHFPGNPSNEAIGKLLGDDTPPPEDAFADDGPDNNRTTDDKDRKILRTVHALALATRASASFPIAFEASFIPVRVGKGDPDKQSDMWEFADWDDKSGGKCLSRYTIDGGVLANTPTKPALDAIRHRVAGDRLIRRVLLLIHPHAERADAVRDTVDVRRDPPTLAKTLTGVMRASSSVGSRSYVEEIERHNELAYRWRGGRTITLETFTSLEELRSYLRSADDGQPTASWRLYRTMRVRRGAYVLAHQIREKCSTPFGDLVRIAREVVDRYAAVSEAQGRTPRLPFVPDEPPCAENLSEGTWQWGLDMAVGMATFASDLLCELHNAKRSSASPSNAAAAKAAETFFTETRRAWHRAANARVALEILGEKEEKQAAGQDDTPSGDGALRPPQEWLTDNLDRYAAGVRPDAPASARASLTAAIIRKEVAEPLWNIISKIQLLKGNNSLLLPQVPLTRANPLLDADGVDNVLEVLALIEVVGDLITEQDGGEGIPSAPIELVQLSAQVDQHFAKGFTSDDKLAGMSLNRFGAFLKRAWRANDWIWGRLDAIKTLLFIVLNPRMLLELKTKYSVEDLIDQLCAATFTPSSLQAATQDNVYTAKAFIAANKNLEALRAKAEEELTNLTAADGSAPLDALVSLVAYGYQISAAGQEVPWLAQSVYDDQDDGASGSKSSAFLTRYNDFRVQHPATVHEDQSQRLAADYQLLRLFVESRLGQEAVGEELPSDMMLRTAATTAAVTATVVSEPASGLSFAKPATMLIRGLVGAPYWIVTGLVQRGQLARAAAATALALGIALLALALLAPLSGFLSTLVPTVGAGSLITVVAYAAARSRSVVHVAALLGLLIPLAALFFHRITADSQTPPKPDTGGKFHFSVQESTLGAICVVVLIAGTVVIANVNSPRLSPLAALGDWISRPARRKHSGPPPAAGVRVRQVLMVVRRTALGCLAIAIAAWAVIVLLGKRQWLTLPEVLRRFIPHDIAHGSLIVFALPMLVIVGHGIVVGWRKAGKLRPYVRENDVSSMRTRAQLTDPAGLAIAWSAVYGTLYVVLAVAIVAAHRMKPAPWAAAAAAASLLLGWMFSVVAIYLIFWLREKRLVRRLAAAYASSREPLPEKVRDGQEFTLRLLNKLGEQSTYLIKNDEELTLRGREVAARALAKSRVLQLSGRTSRPQTVDSATA